MENQRKLKEVKRIPSNAGLKRQPSKRSRVLGSAEFSVPQMRCDSIRSGGSFLELLDALKRAPELVTGRARNKDE